MPNKLGCFLTNRFKADEFRDLEGKAVIAFSIALHMKLDDLLKTKLWRHSFQETSTMTANVVSVVLGSQWGDEGKGKLVDMGLSADHRRQCQRRNEDYGVPLTPKWYCTSLQCPFPPFQT